MCAMWSTRSLQLKYTGGDISFTRECIGFSGLCFVYVLCFVCVCRGCGYPGMGNSLHNRVGLTLAIMQVYWLIFVMVYMNYVTLEPNIWRQLKY